MTLKRHLAVLERAFSAEVTRALSSPKVRGLPIQLGKSKAVGECVELGYLVPAEGKLGSTLGPITFRGHELTHLGRMLYCRTCKELTS